MIPSAKIVNRDKRTTREHVEHAQDTALLTLEELLQLNRVDSWHRNMRANPVHDKCQQQKNQPTT
jgi:hypothetical protein